MGKKILITRKIEIKILSDILEERRKIWNTLFDWRNICIKASNKIVTHCYFQLQNNEFIYLTEKAKALYQLDKDVLPHEAKLTLNESIKELQIGTLTTSHQNVYYRLVSALFKGQIPTSILTCLSSQVFRTFNAEKVSYSKGERSLRNYKNTQPIPFRGTDIRNVTLHQDEYKGRKYNNYSFSLFGIAFKTHFGRDLSKNGLIWERAFTSQFVLPEWVWDCEEVLSKYILSLNKDNGTLSVQKIDFQCTCQNEPGDKMGYIYRITANNNIEEYTFKMTHGIKNKNSMWSIKSDYKLCTSSIVIENKRKAQSSPKANTKIFLLATFEIEKEAHKFDPENALECYLDPEIPIKVCINGATLQIGNKEEFQFKRISIQNSIRRLQQSCKYNKSGVNRKRKLQTLEKVSNAERDYINYKTHQYSKGLIDLAVKCHAGVIVLKNQTQNEEIAKDDAFLLRNWSFGDLKTKITYKASRVGVEVIVE